MLTEMLAKKGSPKICPQLVLIRDRHILLGMRNYTPDKWKQISVWTTPGGRCDEGETLEEALRREVKEELDLGDIRILDFLGEIPGAYQDDRVPLFLAETDGEPKLMEPEKFSEWRWVPFSEYLAGAPYDSMNPEAHKLISSVIRKML